MRHLWSLHLSSIPHHTDFHLIGMSPQPASSFCLYMCPGFPNHTDLQPSSWWRCESPVRQVVRCHTDLQPGRNVFLTSWFILFVFFLTGAEMSVVSTCVWDPCHMDLCPGRNIYMTHWFTLSVLFLKGGDMSVVPTRGQNSRHTDLHPRINVYLTSWFILSVWYLTGGDMSAVPTCVWGPSSQGPPPW